jgi:hypothetical protein
MRRIGIAIFIVAAFLLPLLMRAQQRPAASKPEALVEDWFKRWNALDGSEKSVESFLELYQPNAMHEVPPSAKQIGPVFFEARDGIRKMAEDFGRANTDQAYRLETVSANEKSTQLFYVAEGPWGGPGVGVQFVGAYTVRETKKRYMYPGAAFFHLKDGKIVYAKFYSSRDELAEVRP